MAALAVYGIVKAAAYWGAYAVPNPDFPGFVRVGQALWSGQRPSSFKRGPVLGLVLVALGRVMDGDVMRAGWWLNAVLSVANVVLVFLVARRLVGRAAPFVAILTMTNPLVIDSQVNPIAETLMIFLTLLTLWLVFRGSAWAYVAASVATMTRYECAMLILLAFLVDGFRSRSRRGWLRALACSAGASVPFLIWMICTAVYWSPGQSHYIKNYGHGVAIGNFLKYCWQIPFRLMVRWPGELRVDLAGLLPPAQAQAMGLMFQSETEIQSLRSMVSLLNGITAVAMAAGLVCSAVAAVVRRHVGALVLWGFVVFYFLVHGLRAATVPRYVVPISWILVVLAVFGYGQGWRYLRRRWSARDSGAGLPVVETALQVGVLLGGAVWLVGLLRYVAWYPSSRMVLGGNWVLLAGMLGLVVAGAAYWAAARGAARVGAVTAVVVGGVLFCSYHGQAVKLVGNNAYYLEFKILMDWFQEHTAPGEKLASRWANTLEYVVPERRADLVAMQTLGADTLEGFIENCRKRGIRYVTWSTRGRAETRRGLEAVAPILEQPQSTGPLQFLDRIRLSEDRWINVFVLVPQSLGVAPRAVPTDESAVEISPSDVGQARGQGGHP